MTINLVLAAERGGHVNSTRATTRQWAVILHYGSARTIATNNAQSCNNYKSGNLSEYRSNLLIKIGLERVEWLEGPHDPVKYTIEDLQEMLSKYQSLNKKWVQSPR